ncbi:MAG: carbohydrate binding domain-containing protein, partial [Rhodanobacter sp.]
MTVRTNYVKNPSFEVDLTGYTTQGASATLARDTTTSWSGSASVKTTDSASNYRVLVWGATGAAAANSDSIAVTVGDSWAFSAYARWVTGGTSGNLTAKIHCFNSSGSWITDLQGSATTIPGTGAWTRVSVTGTIPANTAKIGVTLVTAGINTYNIDALLLEKSATVGAYFDGSTTSTGTDTYAWTGTANASTSTDTAVTSIPGSSSGTGTAVGKIALNPSQTAAGTVKPALGITGAQMATGTATGVPGLYTTASQTATGTASASLGLSVSQIASGAAGATLGGRLDVSQTATGTASGALSNHNHLSVSQTGTGSANGQIVLPTPGAQTAEGTAYAELFYTAPPTPLDAQPLQKLSDFTLSTSAVHTDPTQGAGSAATISAVFTAGPFPDAALGTEASFHNGAIGDWTGTVSQLRTVEGSAKVSVTVDTPVTKLAQEFRLYPHLPTTPSTATAAEAVDYWTQTCGVFYDKIDGDVCFYQSGYGHPYAYGEDLGNTKLYEKSYTPLYRAGRTALNFGSLSQCAMFEDSKARIDVSVTPNRKLVLSTAVTSGAAGTARFVFDDGRTLALTVSSGTVFLYCGSTILASVGITGEGRIWGSLEKVGGTSWAVRLSTSTGSDTGTLLMPVDFKPYSRLLRAEFEGTAGARYGTYLAVADAHPTAVPDVQKDLAATKKPLAFVPGFVGTVWDKMNEFGSVNRLDFSYENQMLTMRPRSSTLAFPANFDRLERTWTRVLKYRQVAVMDQQSKAVNTGDGLLYRSDSVISVKRGEVYETTVQTKHSILSVQNPVCVNGIEPFPYKGGNGATGQYVVTGADGYIVSPAYWNDNGGKVEVFL